MINFIFALAAPPQGQAQTPPPVWVTLFPLILVFFVMYIIMIRPQQRKQKEHQKMIQNLKKNDEVITYGGIHGTIVNVKEKTFILRIDDNVKVEVEKGYIATIKKARSTEAQEIGEIK